MNAIIAKNIRTFRESRAWSQEQLATIAGVAPRTIQRAERGEGMSAETLLAVAGAFDVDIEMLRVDPDNRLHSSVFESLGLSAEDLNNPDAIKARVEDFHARHEVIPLTIVEASVDLGLAISAVAMMFECQLRSDAVQDVASKFESDLQDMMDLWDELDPAARREMQKQCFSHVTDLRRRGAAVLIGHHKAGCFIKLGSDAPVAVATVFVVVAPAQSPPTHLAVLRSSAKKAG